MNKQYKYCFKEKKLVEYSAHGEETCNVVRKVEEKIQENEINFEGDRGSLLSELGAVYKESNQFFSNLPSELCSLNLTQNNFKKAMELIVQIVEHTTHLSKKLVQRNCDTSKQACENIDSSSDYILKKIKTMNTTTKLKNIIRKNPLFVEPTEKAIGLKWKNAKVDPLTQIPDHGLIQSTFQYVSILKTLEALFKNDIFRELYIKYNKHEKHKCVSGIYKDFCCGSICRSVDIFNDPLSLQLVLAVDAFEVCCPIKTKAKKHKVDATYFQIKNVPTEYRSKLENIFLVSLCSTINFKREYDYNHIADLIVDEINILATDGIKVGDDCVKGSLINISADNLGAHTVIGFVECFIANYYCRYCECSKTECQTLVKEDKRKLRTKPKYEVCLKRAENAQLKQDLTASKGVKRKCSFNDLKYFHILDNVCVDVMHDINEGCISYCLSDFFNLIVKKKIITADEIQTRVRDFNYGISLQYNKPSLVAIEKPNLNQNATQLYCLMVNMPFIFVDIKEKIKPYWEPIQTLLKCMQIIFSTTIAESDIKSLEKYIQLHLKAVIEVFDRTLAPKHHFLVHYPTCIRRHGPPIHLWTMRMEAKHKVLTEIARRKMNFINLTKTLAHAHQEIMCKPIKNKPRIKPSETSGDFLKSMQYQKYESFVKRDINADFDTIRVHKFAKHDSIDYRESSLLVENGRIYEIVNILSINSNVFFLCELYQICVFNEFLNSFEIEKSDSVIVLSFDKLQNKIVYDKMFAEGKYFIIADKLNIAKLT